MTQATLQQSWQVGLLLRWQPWREHLRRHRALQDVMKAAKTWQQNCHFNMKTSKETQVIEPLERNGKFFWRSKDDKKTFSGEGNYVFIFNYFGEKFSYTQKFSNDIR